jgi:hypothetical protein
VIFVEFKNKNNSNNSNKSSTPFRLVLPAPFLMVFRKISADMKQRALQMIDEGWELAEVAEVLGVPGCQCFFEVGFREKLACF